MAGDDFVSPSAQEGGQDKVDKRPPDFAVEDLVAEIAKQLSVADDDGLTTRELCERALGRLPTSGNMSITSRIIHDMVIIGELEYAGKKQLPNILGEMQSLPAWRLVKKQGKTDYES
jgi:hypothetical protein